MPTYVCSVLENSVDERQKDAIAEAIARVHSEETGAPKFFCQIVIDEKKPASRYVGPSRSSGQIMEWSGRAPAPPAIEAGNRRQRQGARHVSDTERRDRRNGHRYGKNSFHVVGLDQRGAIVL